jgi:hypothetical protein
MIFQPQIQTAGLKNVSDIILKGVQTRATKGSINLSWNYNKVGDLDIVPTLKPTGVLTNTASPTNTYRFSTGKVINKLDYMVNYNRLSIDFGSTVRTVPLTSNTLGINQLVNIDPPTTTNKLMRLVIQNGATANATVRVYINNSSTINKQIDITLPVANARYIIDDVDWQTAGTYGVINASVLVDGINKGTTTAVVTSNGTLPVNGKYLSVTAVGVGGAELIETDFYNNEFQKYGSQITGKGCCFTDALVKIEKELQDLICKDAVTSSYTKKKTGTFTVKLQKMGTVLYALLQGSDVFESTINARIRTEKVTAYASGANIVVQSTGNISDVAIECSALIKTVDNMTSANLVGANTNYYYSVNTTSNEIILPSTVPVGTEVEIGYYDTRIGQRTDLMQLSSDLPMVIYYTVTDVSGRYATQYELSTTSVKVTDSLGDDSDTVELEFTLSAEENLNYRTQIKL